jgi:hypothetical protein
MGRATRLLMVWLVSLAGCGSDALHGLGQGNVDVVPQDLPACTTSVDCPSGTECKKGQCVPIDPNKPNDPPNNPPDDPPTNPPPAIWVGGQWLTEYHLDLSDYVGPLGGLGSEIDLIDQLLLGSSDILDLPIAGDLIGNIIETYIPSWVGTLVSVLNNVVHFFQDVKIQGTMTLNHGNPDTSLISGTEQWTWGFVSIIDNCPLGESDPSYPGCALVSVPLNRTVTDFGVIGAAADPFTGTMSGYNLVLGGRQVRMAISQFVLYVIDQAVRIATQGQYTTLNDALSALVDCAGFQTGVEGILCSNLNICGAQPSVGTACVQARGAVIARVTSALTEITVDWEVMKFDQKAVASDRAPGDGNADKLGNPPAAPGTIDNGSFEVLVGADLTGTWSGKRP